MLNKNLTSFYTYLFLLTLSAFQICLAQLPDTIWTKIYGDSDDEYGYYAEQTDDGGFILVASIDVSGNDDVWLIKTDANGDTLWTKTYGTYHYDYPSCVHQTNDGGYIIFGETDSFDPNFFEGWLIKTNSSGDTLWTKHLGDYAYYFVEDGIVLSGGGYVFVGSTKISAADPEDIWLVKTDSDGDTIWTKTFGGPDHDIANSICRTSDGGFIIGGVTKSFGEGDYDAWLIRTNADGNLVWTKTYGDAASNLASDVKQTDDGGFIIAGSTEESNHYHNAWLVKTDYNGDTLWTRKWGGDEHDGAMSVVQTSDGGYVWTGYIKISTFNQDLWVFKADLNGNPQWSKTYGGTFNNIGRSINKTNDGSFVIAADYYSEETNTRDVWLLKVDPDISNVERNDNAQIPETIILKQNYPNPFNPTTTIEFGIPESQFVTLEVYNLLGEQVGIVVNEFLSAGNYDADWNAAELPSGIYIYKLVTGEHSLSNKMILMK